MSRGERAMTEFTFAVLVEGLDVEDDAHCDASFAGGLEDSVLEDRDGRALATFSRTAVDAASALSSAIRDIEHSVPGARVVRVDEQLMNLGDVAETLPPELIAATNPELTVRSAGFSRGA